MPTPVRRSTRATANTESYADSNTTTSTSPPPQTPVQASNNNFGKSNLSSYAWLFIFLPSLAYYLQYLSGGMLSHRYEAATYSIILPGTQSHTSSLEEMLHLTKKGDELEHPVEILSKGFNYLRGITWFHDEDLNRGYVLLSDSNANRIWRWEIGGGPIAIGRSLHMERSGCRSLSAVLCSRPNKGSAGLTTQNDLLVISELGEKRVVRIESDGARTPLLVKVSVLDMIFVPPFGDMILLLENGQVGKAKAVVDVKPISAMESRAAHKPSWPGNQLLPNVLTVYDEMNTVSSLEMLDWDHVLVTGVLRDKPVIMKVFVGDPDLLLSDQDDDSKNTKQRQTNANQKQTSIAQIYYDISPHLPPRTKPEMGGITIDQNGNIYVAVTHYGVIILSKEREHLATIPLPYEELTNLAFGQDGFLYILSKTTLMRLKVKVKGMKHQEDMYKKKKG